VSLQDILRELKQVREDLQFYIKTVHSLRKENAELKKRIGELEGLLAGKIPEIKFEPWKEREKRLKPVFKLIDRCAIEISKRLGRPWTSEELDKYLRTRFPFIKVSYETVRRRAQLLVREGLLIRVRPNTYFYNVNLPRERLETFIK